MDDIIISCSGLVKMLPYSSPFPAPPHKCQAFEHLILSYSCYLGGLSGVALLDKGFLGVDFEVLKASHPSFLTSSIFCLPYEM